MNERENRQSMPLGKRVRFPQAIVAGFAFAVILQAVEVPAAKAQWTQPTPDELSMTAVPQAPGASAVYLFREELQQDHLHMFSQYARIKVLTEGGKQKANIELKYGRSDEGLTVTDIAGRTIHPDGTVVPFTGKPYERTIVKTQDFQRKAKVFTLPDVTVGSIIEYRYKLRWDDHYFIAPAWIVQDDLYLLKGHFVWRPTDSNLRSGDERHILKDNIAWTPLLPEGVTVKMTRLPVTTGIAEQGSRQFELNVQNIPASPEEEYMPPIKSLGYRVLFYYSAYSSGQEFWKAEGNYWSKTQDKFIGPDSGVKAAAQQLTSGSNTQEEKLKKLYAAVEELENTDYTRQHSKTEDKSEGLRSVHTTDEIWAQKRGTSDQITELFVAMARAVGMKAYVMRVTNRERDIFIPAFQELYQLDDDIAIVTVDGKEKYFDPGSRYCPYGHLEWKHSDTGGLRQADGGSTIASTPGENYMASGTNRVANLTMDDTGVVSGKLSLKFYGAPALQWRQKALIADREEVERAMKESVEGMLSSNMEVTLLSIDKLQEYEEPLTAAYMLKGPVGSATGKRLLIASDLFEENAKPTFAHEKRELAICFNFRYNARDVVRINVPPSFQVESVPAEGSFKLSNQAIYNYKSTADPKGVTVRRDLYIGEVFYKPTEYPDLRTFYSQFEAKDKEPIILKVAVSAAAPAGN